MARTTTASIRLAPAELASWRASAEAHGLSLSDWLRDQVGAARPRSRPARGRAGTDPRLLAELARIGNNLNQLARAANSQRLPELVQLQAIEQALRELPKCISDS